MTLNPPVKKAEYGIYLEGLTDELLRQQCATKIWLSAYANNNLTSAYHWQCHATYVECQRRGKLEIYKQAHQSLLDELGS